MTSSRSAANEAGLSAEPVHSVENALKILAHSWDTSEPAPRILIGGSLYLAGDVLSDNGTPPLKLVFMQSATKSPAVNRAFSFK